ncbi:hypothetical protein BDR05DRAFT_1000681 [Suillus weaverae]|nr:hypothetical protein BDR05DRAFT_1000681 [Suillus weaverae]
MPCTPSETPSQTQMSSTSPGILCHPMPSPLPILAPDSMTQPIASHNLDAGMGTGAGTGMMGMGMGDSSELMGGLGDTYVVSLALSLHHLALSLYCLAPPDVTTPLVLSTHHSPTLQLSAYNSQLPPWNLELAAPSDGLCPQC